MIGRKVIIVGGGISGLSAGCYALMNGFETIIFEQQVKLGGTARSWVKKGYSIDGCPSPIWGITSGNLIFDIYRELGILPQNELLPIKKYEVFDEATGYTVDLAAGFNELERSLKELSPQDEEIIEDIIDAAIEMKPDFLADLIYQPLEIERPDIFIKRLYINKNLNMYLKGVWRRPFQNILDKIKSDLLRRIFSILQSPNASSWIAAMSLSLITNRQLAFFKNGSSDLIRSLQIRYEKLGGVVRTNSRVVQILAKDRQVYGIKIKDGEIQYSNFVIFTSGSYDVLNRLLIEKSNFLDKLDFYRSLEICPPRILIALGIKVPIFTAPENKIFLINEPVSQGLLRNNQLNVRVFSADGSVSPKGNGLIQIELDSDWQYWYKLRTLDLEMYIREKKRFADEVLHRLEKYYPISSQNLDMVDVSTPYTYWRYTSNREGTRNGWLPSPLALSKKRKLKVSGFKGLYMAGHWADICWSLPQCLISGRLSIQNICNDLGINFKAFAPSLTMIHGYENKRGNN